MVRTTVSSQMTMLNNGMQKLQAKWKRKSLAAKVQKKNQ
jgi:hypothetical protein